MFIVILSDTDFGSVIRARDVSDSRRTGAQQPKGKQRSVPR